MSQTQTINILHGITILIIFIIYLVIFQRLFVDEITTQLVLQLFVILVFSGLMIINIIGYDSSITNIGNIILLTTMLLFFLIVLCRIYFDKTYIELYAYLFYIFISIAISVSVIGFK